MSMGKKRAQRQEDLWVRTDQIAKGPGHPFYARLEAILQDARFDDFVEGLCRPFYAEAKGRPGIAPRIYFRMLMIGYFEGIDSERGIAWRVADSLGLREFLGYTIAERTPDHSTLCVIRRRLPSEIYEEVFSWVLARLVDHKLLKGQTIGIDATTLEANAAMRSIVRRDTGETYQEYLKRLAAESGIADPTPDDLRQMDRKRKKKTSNDDWENPHDPDAKVGKMKDGRTHMLHKAEHAVDLDTGATVAVTLSSVVFSLCVAAPFRRLSDL